MIFTLHVSFGLLTNKPENKTCYQNPLLPYSQLIVFSGQPCIYDEQYNVNMKGQTIARIIRQTLSETGSNVVNNNFDTQWSYQLEFGSQFTESDYRQLAKDNITVSQIPNHKVFTLKNELARNIQDFTQKHSDLKLVPLTYIMPNDSQKIFNVLSTNDVKTNFMQFKKPQQQYYIFKKAISARGFGIKLINSLEQLKKILNGMNIQESAVLQEYLTNTVLIDGYKFDMRIYFVITSIDPFIVHVYRDGIARLATHKFTNPNSFNQDDLRMHLTNFAVNRNKDNNSNEPQKDGMFFKQSYQDIIQYLAQHKELFLHKTKHDVYKLRMMSEQELKDHLELQVNKTLYKSLMILKQKLQKEYKDLKVSSSDYNKQFFGLYGADIIFLDNSDALLLEINLQPALGISTEVDKRVKQRLTTDLFNIVGLRSTVAINTQYSNDIQQQYNKMFMDFKQYLQKTDPTLLTFYENNTKEVTKTLMQLVDETSRYNRSFDMLIPNFQGIDFIQFSDTNLKDQILNHFTIFMKSEQFNDSFQQLIKIKIKEDTKMQQQSVKDEL